MRLISLTQNSLQAAVEAAAEAIRAGMVLIAPTDTVYGLIANAADEKAIARVYSIKNRDPKKPLPFFVKNIAMAKKLAKISRAQETLLDEYWPGKVTAILKINNGLKIFGTNGETIALRIPFHHFINSLLETADIPLCGTSANISGVPASVKIDEVLNQFAGRDITPDLVINAGDLEASRPSTIIDLTKKERPVTRS